MFVRSTYAVGDPQQLHTAIEAIRGEGNRLMAEQSGYRGAGMFVDRELGKLLMGSWWDTEADRRASNDALRERRAHMLRPFVAAMTTEDYEVIAAQRPARVPDGARFRLSRLEFDPVDADLVADTMRGMAMERLQAIPGVLGVAMLMDRAAGRMTVGVTYQDSTALAQSRAAQAELRDEATGKAHLSVRSVEEFEVVFIEAVSAR